ncbi:MAG: LysR family transcriptional regulator [Opitutus sp.]|nr:LysR family transcriptional regulator [Opitutus sp.]MCS6247308.1 LysR family transcriptional regulator [Opitutus sp.]MCS6273777.1 LysR family transcriptional regulator [Opitutus sp.]MCS6278286.1 LysR family transcriptional regulator [Opitutus sp.]MCS6299396.1 LysR family transcriptional regulator [Opitutus sp.]
MPREYQFNFELRHLVYFLEVARQLHFRKAAETLAIAQPALSRQIAQLEAALGTPLFTRSRRKVELTAAGRALAERVEPVLRGLAKIPAELQSLAQGVRGHIKTGFTGLAMATVLPAILREFHRTYPGIRLELNESPTSAQVAALQAGELGCGFFHPEATPTPGLKTKLLLREKNGVLLPADHPLAPLPSLHLRDLAATPFVLFPRAYNPGFYDRVLAAFAKAGVTPHIAEEVWPRANGVGLVRAGIGATFVCPSEARQLPPEVVFRPLDGPAPESSLVIGWKASADLDPALASFLSVAVAAAETAET